MGEFGGADYFFYYHDEVFRSDAFDVDFVFISFGNQRKQAVSQIVRQGAQVGAVCHGDGNGVFFRVKSKWLAAGKAGEDLWRSQVQEADKFGFTRFENKNLRKIDGATSDRLGGAIGFE